MRRNPELNLRKVGSSYMIVSAGGNTDLTRVFTLNETAAWVWNCIGDREFTAEQLTVCMCEKYEVDPETASRDIRKLISEWISQGLVLAE